MVLFTLTLLSSECEQATKYCTLLRTYVVALYTPQMFRGGKPG